MASQSLNLKLFSAAPSPSNVVILSGISTTSAYTFLMVKSYPIRMTLTFAPSGSSQLMPNLKKSNPLKEFLI